MCSSALAERCKASYRVASIQIGSITVCVAWTEYGELVIVEEAARELMDIEVIARR